MGENLLVNERIEAGAKFIRNFNDSFPVSVALWVVPADTDNIYLYVASDDIDGRNIDVAYGEAIRKLQGARSEWLDPFEVKLINTSNPLANEAIRIRDRYAVPIPTRFRGTSIGGTGIDGAYIYPPVSALATAT